MQAPEYLHYQGATHGFAQEPLEPYLDSLEPRPDPWIGCTDNSRGYVAEWSLTRGRLYFCEFLEGGDLFEKERPIEFGDLFPGEAGPVFAHWFDGFITFDAGKELGVIGTWHHVFETKVTLEFRAGHLLSEKRRYLTPEDFANAEKAYGIRLAGLDLDQSLIKKLGVRNGNLLDLSYRSTEDLFRDFGLTVREIDRAGKLLEEHGLRLDMSV